MSIGQFAQATGLTLKRLRHYDDTGVLHPARTDAATGYRWYAPDQVADALVLVTLRDSGVGLAEIASILRARDDRDTLVAEALGRARADVESARDRVALAAHLMGALPRVAIAVRWVPPQLVVTAAAELSLDECAPWFDETYARLTAPVRGHAGAAGATYASAFFTEGRGTVTAFVPVPEGTPGATPLAGGTFAVAAHDGPYDTFRTTYAALGAHVHRHHTPDPDAAVREHYLIGPTESPDPHAWRSEVHWPIRPEPQEHP